MSVDSEAELEDESDPGADAELHRCVCGYAAASMDQFVDHVSDDHDALDIAVEALHAETLEVVADAE